MIDLILQFHEFLKDKSIKIANKKLHKVIQNVVFLPISEKLEQSNNEDIFQKFNETSVITINKFSDHGQPTEAYFVIGFKQTLLFIQSKNLSYLLPLFESKNDLNFLFLSNSKDSFEKHVNIKYQEIKSFIFIEKICFGISKYIQTSISSDDKSKLLMEKILPIIEPCISNNLALECYQKVKSITRFNGSQINICENEQPVNEKYFSKDDYIEISVIAYGSSCTITLAFLIEKVELFVIKKIYANESAKLNDREISNYKKLSEYNHPFLPKLICVSKNNELGFGIEFIYGQELSKINSMNLDIKDKFTIIFKLLIIFEFIHHIDYVYRDLKPNNIIIDQNKTPVLIDFDRMVEQKDLANKNIVTVDFVSNFVDPEIGKENFSFECDIYSIGKIMLYILDDYIKESDTDQTLNKICQKCISKKVKYRPQISELIIEFYTNFYCQIQTKNFFKNNKKYFSKFLDENTIMTMEDFEIEQDELNSENETQISQKIGNTEQINIKNIFDSILLDFKDASNIALGLLYGQTDIDKAIEYFSVSAKNNDVDSLCLLGEIFNDESKGRFDINKAIECYTKAAELNSAEAMYELSKIYLSGEHIERDINKAIKYLTRSAVEFNYVYAQHRLGNIYQNGINGIKRDMEKSVYFYHLASKQGEACSQLKIALIYLNGEENIQQNIDKAIKYFKLAADQGEEIALYNLGLIYTSTKYYKLDIPRGIYYLELASRKNYVEAQYQLGNLYETGQFVSKNMNKCINYYEFAAKNGHSMAQYKLGQIYRKGIGVTKDIKKAIIYYELAAKSNHILANYYLGCIFWSNEYIKSDINKAIYYFKRAADLNDDESQYNLACIYFDTNSGNYDKIKAFYYLKLAIEHGHEKAELLFGILCLVTKRFEMALQYLNKASAKNNSTAQLLLAQIFMHGIYEETESDRTSIDPKEINNDKINFEEKIDKTKLKEKIDKINFKEKIDKINFKEKIDKTKLKEKIDKINFKEKIDQKIFNEIDNNYEKKNAEKNHSYYKAIIPADSKKAIEYLKQSSNNENEYSLYLMGVLYLAGVIVPKNNKHGIYLLSLSAEKKCEDAQFLLGFLYHEGNYVQHDIKQAIHYYKEGSTIRNMYSKNNLGIIYKNQKQLDKSINYFQEAIQLGSKIALYNLAHIYFFDLNELDEAIKLSIKLCSISPISTWCKFLCLILVKKFDFDIEIVQKEIHKCNEISNKLKNILLFYLTSNKLYDKNIYNEIFKFYRKTEYAYNIFHLGICSSELYKETPSKYTLDLQHLNITSEFHEGFGITI